MYVFLIFLFTFFCMVYSLLEIKFPKKINITLFGFFTILFSVLVASRPINVPDTEAYLQIYKNIDIYTKYPVINLIVYQFDVEMGFVKFIQIFKRIFGENDRFFLFAVPLLNISLTTIAFKKIINHINEERPRDIYIKKYSFILMLCLYTSYFGLMYNGIVLRASFTLSLSLLALTMYMEKKYLRMVVLLILAVTFHRMALIGLVIIVIFKYMPILKHKTYVIIWGILLIMGLLQIGDIIIITTIDILYFIVTKVSVLSTFSHYLDNYVINAQIGFKNLFFYAIGFILLIWKVESKIFFKLLNIFYSGLFLMTFINNIAGASRIYDFMTFYMIILLYIAYKYGKGNIFYKWSIVLTIVISSNVLVLSVWELL